ncbi:MAG: hypothetical protein NUW37_00990 [Planctomycetes bacterium]|nr:hypothetical protein [Planctomycetota bacterium]
MNNLFLIGALILASLTSGCEMLGLGGGEDTSASSSASSSSTPAASTATPAPSASSSGTGMASNQPATVQAAPAPAAVRSEDFWGEPVSELGTAEFRVSGQQQAQPENVMQPTQPANTQVPTTFTPVTVTRPNPHADPEGWWGSPVRPEESSAEVVSSQNPQPVNPAPVNPPPVNPTPVNPTPAGPTQQPAVQAVSGNQQTQYQQVVSGNQTGVRVQNWTGIVQTVLANPDDTSRMYIYVLPRRDNLLHTYEGYFVDVPASAANGLSEGSNVTVQMATVQLFERHKEPVLRTDAIAR